MRPLGFLTKCCVLYFSDDTVLFNRTGDDGCWVAVGGNFYYLDESDTKRTSFKEFFSNTKCSTCAKLDLYADIGSGRNAVSLCVRCGDMSEKPKYATKCASKKEFLEALAVLVAKRHVYKELGKGWHEAWESIEKKYGYESDEYRGLDTLCNNAETLLRPALVKQFYTFLKKNGIFKLKSLIKYISLTI